MMNEGSEFQADGAAHRKARFASSVLVIGTVSSKVSDERLVVRFNFLNIIVLICERVSCVLS